MGRPRLVVADEHRLVLEGLQHILKSDFEVVGTACDGRTLVDLACALQPDVIVTETTLPLLSGVEALIRIKKQHPRMRALFVTRHTENQHLRNALRAEASGYVLKDCTGSELITAIRAVLDGGSYITPLMTADLFSTFRDPSAEIQTFRPTPRQREILQLIVEGLAMKEIASLLNISRKTVEFHKHSLMQGLEFRTNSQLIRYAMEQGFTGSRGGGGQPAVESTARQTPEGT